MPLNFILQSYFLKRENMMKNNHNCKIPLIKYLAFFQILFFSLGFDYNNKGKLIQKPFLPHIYPHAEILNLYHIFFSLKGRLYQVEN